MKAVYLTKFGSPTEAFEIREVAKPVCGAQQVLIRAEGFGINFADVLARRGLYGETPPLPCVIGYEVVGQVEAQGAQVKENWVGKRVVALTRFGGYAEYAVTDYNGIAEISENYPASKALALATQYTTAYVCAVESLNLHPGDKVLVHAAAGGVGVALCQIALNAGCEVFATAGADFKLDFLKSMGVHHTINYNRLDYVKSIKHILKGGALDVSFNAIAGNTIKKDWRLVGPGGKLVVYGAASQVQKGGNKLFGDLSLLLKTGFLTPLLFIVHSKSLIGVNLLKLGQKKPHLISSCLKTVVADAEAGKLKPVVHQVCAIDGLNDVHLALENRQTMGKTAVMWNR